MSDDPKTGSIDELERMLQAEEGCAVTILPDGTVLIDEEKRTARRAELITHRMKVGATY